MIPASSIEHSSCLHTYDSSCVISIHVTNHEFILQSVLSCTLRPYACTANTYTKRKISPSPAEYFNNIIFSMFPSVKKSNKYILKSITKSYQVYQVILLLNLKYKNSLFKNNLFPKFPYITRTHQNICIFLTKILFIFWDLLDENLAR